MTPFCANYNCRLDFMFTFKAFRSLNSAIVAKGRIRCLDPDEVVGSEEIRPNWCGGKYSSCYKKISECFVRKNGLFVTIQDHVFLSCHVIYCSMMDQDQ